MAAKKDTETITNNAIWIEMTTLPTAHITKEQEKTIISKVAKKYNVQPGKVRFTTKRINPNGNGEADSPLNAENIQNIQDPKYQVELFKKYIKENGIKDYNWEEILNIDSRVNSFINYDDYEKGRRFELKYARWKNFLSYGDDNFFDFTKLKGLIHLKGEPANKSGKSTFAYDLIHFALFGKTRSGKADTKAEIFNNYRPEEREVVVELAISINGENYLIKRTLTKPDPKKKTKNISNTVEYYRLNPNGSSEKLDDSDNLNGLSSTKTTKAIKEAIGSEEDFDRIISANAKDLDELISMKDTDRGRVLSRWIGLLPIEDKEQKAKELWAQTSASRICNIYDRETLKDEIKSLKEDIEENQKTILSNTNKIKNLEGEVKEHQATKDQLLASKQIIDDVLLNVDVTTIEKKKEEVIEEGKKKGLQKETIEKEINEIGDIEYSEDEYKALLVEKETISNKRTALRTKLQTMQSAIKTLAEGEYCPYCKRKLDNVDNSQQIAEYKKQLDEGIKIGLGYKVRCEELEKQISEIEIKRKNYIEKNKKEIKLQALNNEINTLRTNFKQLKTISESYQKNKDAIAQNSKTDAEINVLNINIETNRETIKRLENENTSLSKDNQTYEDNIKEREINIKKIEQEIETEKNWKLYLQMVGKDGISKMMLKSTLPTINEALNNLLCDVADFEVEVDVNERNDIEFWLVRDDVKTRLSAGSGLEKTMASLALRVVLGKMSNLSKPPFIVLDEILGSVAAENYDDMKKLYDKIVLDYDYILHICHIDLDWYDGGTITVVKENNISKIVQY